MSENNIAIKVEGISKCYRLGLKESMQDSFGGAFLNFLKSPITNFRKYRSLYQFEQMDSYQENVPSDVLWALRDVSFDVRKGEIVGIIGLNGAGKSTLLKILSKITLPISGSVTIRGRISSLLEVGTGFHPELSGRENVYLNGTILGMRKKEIDGKFDSIVDFSGIEKFIDTPVKRYSSGMKVRLAFAVAAFLEPEILLIDEVLAVGDAQFQRKCLNKMEDISGSGRTVLFVSHNMQAVTRLCPRSILLKNGRVCADGPSPQIVSAYMDSDKGTRPLIEWPDVAQAPGDEVVRLSSVRVCTEEGQVSDALDIRKPVIISMEYIVRQGGYELMPYIRLYNDDGVKLFTSNDNDPGWRRRSRRAGVYVSSVCIPGNFLSEGIVYVGTCGIRSMNPQVNRVRVTYPVAFHIIDGELGVDTVRGDYLGPMAGVIRPWLKWETQVAPIEATVVSNTSTAQEDK